MRYSEQKLTRWALMALLAVAAQATAALPQTLNYQGRMRNLGAGPVTDSTGNTVVFKIYDAAQSSVLWTETWDSGTQCVATKDGLFNVVLGTFVPLTLAFDQQYYLDIKFNSDPAMTPRLPLTMAPYAFNAASVSAPLSLSSSAGSGTLSSRNYNNLLGPGIVGRGQMLGVSAVADASGGTGVAAFAAFGNAIYGRNYGGGAFVPSILGEATGTGMGVRGRSLSGGGEGSLGGSLSGGGSTGVNGKAGLGGVGVMADQGGGTYALQANGDTRFDSAGNTATFNTYVNFTGGTSLSTGGLAPLSLTYSAVSAAPLSVSNTTGIAILAQGMTGVASVGYLVGLSATAVSATGVAGYFSAVTGVVAVGAHTGLLAQTSANTANSAAVLGLASNVNPFAIAGLNLAAGAGTGIGVYGETSSDAGIGVKGRSTNSGTNGRGVLGTASTVGAYGVVAENTASGGGGSAIGLSATSAGTTGIGIYASAVTALSVSGGVKVYNPVYIDSTGSPTPNLNPVTITTSAGSSKFTSGQSVGAGSVYGPFWCSVCTGSSVVIITWTTTSGSVPAASTFVPNAGGSFYIKYGTGGGGSTLNPNDQLNFLIIN